MSAKRSRRSSPRRRVARRTAFETLESRQMFAAEQLSGLLAGNIADHQLSEPDFWYDTRVEYELDARVGDLEQTLAAANELTGLTRARNDYGFLGLGQTVAVIDSGIAWDHPNLGDGFGSDYRVVGGWDFSEENDANPYDDGPSGAHGTHVAGIVGATKGTTGDEGVAPGVDLVGLRVFNDQGAGYFGWVEKALRWVHTNRHAFSSPITAVNLSLGTAWNAATVPSWSMLEDEFAQLKSDGIFIAVSAGNSFTSYNAPGLSYPAASSSVVPVMSVDDNGSLSYFTQRHQRAIAAPGRTVRSTVPDYVGNQNGRTDDWTSFSGTSMAAPYVAGASVLVREAMQFVGYTNITQDTIYSHMLSTADEVFDAATNAHYRRLNVGAALDALMPEDDFGSTEETAFDLGAIGAEGEQLRGTIGSRGDIDYFRFTATASGTMTFAASTTHYLDVVWTGGGTVSADGSTLAISVVAGQSYSIGLGTSGGVGNFELAISVETAFTFVDWGLVSQQQLRMIAGLSGESWYSVTAERAGYLTAEAFYTATCQLEIAWFNTSLQQIASGTVSTFDAECQRVDRYVGAGEQLFLRVSGTGAGVDFRLTNLVSIEDRTLIVSATDGDDMLAIAAGSATHEVVVNGVTYSVDASEVNSIRIDAGAGRDTIAITGSAGNDTASLSTSQITIQGAGYMLSVVAAEHATVDGGGGSDSATLHDTNGDDTLTARRHHVSLACADGGALAAIGFQQTRTIASGGRDTAEFLDSAGDDVVAAWWNRVYMSGNDYFNDARNFDSTMSRSSAGGNDRAAFYDTAGNDVYAAWSRSAYMTGDGYFNDTRGFSRTTALATTGGNDRAALYDTVGYDIYEAWADRAIICGSGYYNDARGFDRTTALSLLGGNDVAIFHGSTGDDAYVSWADRAVMYGVNYYNDARGFRRTVAIAEAGGYDQAVFFDSAGDDLYLADSGRATMSGAGFHHEARGFQRMKAVSNAGGVDKAVLRGSVEGDRVATAARDASITGLGYRIEVYDFDEVAADISQGGIDTTSLQTTDFIFTLVGS